MKIKAQGLLNAAKYIEELYGRDALGSVLCACRPQTRETFVSSIAINWHPADELCDFVESAERVLGHGVKRLAPEIGAAGARANMKGALLRLAFYWGKPEFLMKRAAGLWRQFNDEGMMDLLYMDDRLVRLEVRDVEKPLGTFCRILIGWCSETATALGVRNVVASHPECRAEGGKRCIFEVRGLVVPQDLPPGSGTAGPGAIRPQTGDEL
jgi:hypothetical protein